MYNDSSLFSNMEKLEPPLQVTLGDGHSLEGTAEGTVVIETLLPDGGTTICRLENTVYVPGLSYSLLSASSTGNTTSFDKAGCEIVNDQRNVIAFATRVGNLYHLKYCCKSQSANVADKANKEKLWHRRYGHLREENLKRLVRDKLVEHFDYDVEKSFGFCKACVGGRSIIETPS